MKKLLLTIGLTFLGFNAMAQCTNDSFNAWSVVNNASNKINVTAAAAMGGTSCGMAVEVINQNAGQASRHFVQDSSPNLEPRYRVAFCFDVNSLPMPTSGPNRRVKIHQAQCAGGNCETGDVVQIKAQNTAGGYELDVWVRDKNIATWRNRHFVPIADAPTRVEYDLDLSAGSFKLWINATDESDPPVINETGLDIADWPVITRGRLGSMDKSTNAGVGSVYYLDEFESRRQTFIGGTCN